ncbi:MAG TPA: serine/threonine-protein kinase [Polyangiales bacterium]
MNTIGTHLCMLVAAATMVLTSHLAWAFQRRVFQARQLGQYKLDVPIGEGGHGQVWRAYHAGLNASVAVKVLKGEWRLDSPQVQRFQREARATFALKHPNTVRMLDYGVTVDGVCYLAMELLEGLTLAQLVAREGPLDQAWALHVVLQAANALAEAHALGIVHRDVKPENLLLTQVGDDPLFCKLVDFGIARVNDDFAPSLTGTGKVVGTPGYIAPEALSGAAADPRADVYALGAVLHFALTGDAPRVAGFDSAATHAGTAWIADPAIARDLKSVLARCLSPVPARRFANASELAAHLRACSDLQPRLSPATAVSKTELAVQANSLPTHTLAE